MDGVEVKSTKLQSYKDWARKRREQAKLARTAESSVLSQPIKTEPKPPSWHAAANAPGKWTVKELPAIGQKQAQPQPPAPSAPKPVQAPEPPAPAPAPKPVSPTLKFVKTQWPEVRIAFGGDHWHVMSKAEATSSWVTQGRVIQPEETVGQHLHDARFGATETGVAILVPYETQGPVSTHTHEVLTVEEAARRSGNTIQEFIEILEDYSTDEEDYDH